MHVLLAQEAEDDFILLFAQLWSVVHQSACHLYDIQRDTNIDGLMKDVSALKTGLPGLILVLAMLQNIYQWTKMSDGWFDV